MDKMDKDDFVYALTQTLAFYGKQLEPMQATFWWDACRERGVDNLKRAMREHIKVGKFAPKPADILGICDNMSQHSPQRAALSPPPVTNCPPEISEAWRWFIGRCTSGGMLFADVQDVDQKTKERYLFLVNEQAFKYQDPDSIPDEYKLKEIWGEL